MRDGAARVDAPAGPRPDRLGWRSSMERFEGRHAFVTGGASGMGLGIARALAGEGALVTIADLDDSSCAEIVATQRDRLQGVDLDTRDRAAWAGAKDEAEQGFGPVDILVNNAGIGPDGHTLAETDPVSFDRLIAINLTGVYNGIATFAPGMQERHDGHILNTASFGGFSGAAGAGPYVASKHAVVALSEVLREEMEPFGIGVSVLCPSAVNTNLRRTTLALGSEASEAALGDRLQREGLSIDAVGARVISAIRANELYVFTHPGEPWRTMLSGRFERIMTAFDATP
jgi:NAD(P)-dependent dehydrogenase (short-subunit alcohol dehydrogenase family)